MTSNRKAGECDITIVINVHIHNDDPKVRSLFCDIIILKSPSFYDSTVKSPRPIFELFAAPHISTS